MSEDPIQPVVGEVAATKEAANRRTPAEVSEPRESSRPEPDFERWGSADPGEPAEGLPQQSAQPVVGSTGDTIRQAHAERDPRPSEGPKPRPGE